MQTAGLKTNLAIHGAVTGIIATLYERITGTPYLTGRCATEDFGPTPGARYHWLLQHLSESQLQRCIDALEPAELHAELESLTQKQARGREHAASLR